ncbi:S1C family serine protease [Virgibacillus chiguensis]|uniref:Trypsin-like peptidase domain-containing protein n=1 Tax=Virgibacillus chiguensis TaxID=411959 RepID=A0A1M5XKD3_9BACI|nr:S1C family serine protease [Virgibacillus chiguensis]SHH99713.1 Trypsin-like peptidase domain-containing protein [Virgibacillus chiguensis]
MRCPTCGMKKQRRTRYCLNCGRTLKRGIVFKLTAIISFLLLVSGGTYLFIESNAANNRLETHTKAANAASRNDPELMNKQSDDVDDEKTVEEKIQMAEKNVYTVRTNEREGAAFLYNDQGILLTSAHLVEGHTEVQVRNNHDAFTGSVIGYSNETNLAAIQVAELAGDQPAPTERKKGLSARDKVIAIGSERVLDNNTTATVVNEVDWHFSYGNFTYEHTYQLEETLLLGYSGGPLLSAETGSIVAINSIAHVNDIAVQFSVPIHEVTDVIEGWIDEPMNEATITEQFFGADGGYFFGDYWGTRYPEEAVTNQESEFTSEGENSVTNDAENNTSHHSGQQTWQAPAYTPPANNGWQNRGNHTQNSTNDTNQNSTPEQKKDNETNKGAAEGPSDGGDDQTNNDENSTNPTDGPKKPEKPEKPKEPQEDPSEEDNVSSQQ